MNIHTPVLCHEVLHYLKVEPGKNYIDATADGGGHAIAVLKAIQPGGKLLALEWDQELFRRLERRFKKECSPFSKNYVLARANFTALERIVRSLSFGPVAGLLFDLGLSSFHLEQSRRGFSFQRDEPLDMRMSSDLGETAADLLARLSRNELEKIIREWGNERYAARIAQAITSTSSRAPIRRTEDLVEVIRAATPPRYRHGRIHFATRTFQALRIAVNRELEHLDRGLRAAADIAARGGRIVTISFHSLEDGLVKRLFREPGIRERFSPLLKTPLRPSRDEVSQNPRSRSARLRAFEKTA